MCCNPIDFTRDDIDGVCPDCGQPTVGSSAFEQCGDSPVCCDTCGYAPCDDSC